MNEPYYDGVFDEPSQDGPIILGFDPDSRGRIWRQPMMHLASLWEAMPRDSEGPEGGYLTDETQPELAGVGDVVRWERIFREVPATHNEAIPYSYVYPSIVDGEIVESTVSTTVAMTSEYFHTTTPEKIPILRKQKFDSEEALLFYLGNIEDYTLIAADDSKVERAWGNIWRRNTPYVTKLTLLAALNL